MATAPEQPSKDERLSTQLENIILDRIAKDRLELPSMPAVAFKCMELLRKPDFSLQRAVTLIEADPILAAQLIRLSNSAAFASREPSRNIQTAVSKLGSQRLRAALVEASTRPLFESKDANIQKATRGLWEHSLAVGLLARDVAVLVGGCDAEEAYLAGLLHDVGKPVLATMMLEAENMMAMRSVKGWIDERVFIAVLQRSHRKVAVPLARRWAMPEPVARAIETCGDFDPANRASVSNIVCFANALAKQQGISVGPKTTEDDQALVMIGRSLLGVDDESVNRLLAGLRDRVRASS
jgi:putative nucleotidyltransferase with HDIG domain